MKVTESKRYSFSQSDIKRMICEAVKKETGEAITEDMVRVCSGPLSNILGGAYVEIKQSEKEKS